MKTTSIRFLQLVLVLIAIGAIIILIRFPMTEGRAQNLDLFSIYSDPFILYGYAASIAFFIALFKAFRLLGDIAQNKLFTLSSIRILKSIKYCAISLSGLIALAALYIRFFHHKDDDPAGFLMLCTITIFICIVVATIVAVLEKILQNAIDLKSENDLTI
ncbi:MAG: DUF2975 domain-containing protein [Bacteroidota bacterium]|nr:DUF2975 domain-containing protein [Bacteroidota bacterium]